MRIINNLLKIPRIIRGLGIFNASNRIRALWWNGDVKNNFGDALTPYLIEKISGKKASLCNEFCLKDYYLVTGSILKYASRNSIVWGAGIINGNEKIKKPKKILAVRGPITRRRLLELGHRCPEVYGDPALLLPSFYNPRIEKGYEVGIIPHYVDYKKIRREVSSQDILIIDLLDSIENIIDKIISCKRTISSSLHGLIASHAYKIPSLWVKFSDELAGDGTKFRDYLLSVGIEPYDAKNLKAKIPALNELKELIPNETELKIDLNRLIDLCPFRR